MIEKKQSFVNKMIAYELNNRIKIYNHIRILDNDDDEKIQEKILELKNQLKCVLSAQIDLEKIQKEKSNYFDNIIDTGEWRTVLPGRDILQNFLSKYGKNQVKWQLFRNLIANELKGSRSIQEVRDILNKIKFLFHLKL